jgi:hypothetical protein
MTDGTFKKFSDFGRKAEMAAAGAFFAALVASSVSDAWITPAAIIGAGIALIWTIRK